MNKNKNIVIIVSSLSAITVFVEYHSFLFTQMEIADIHTLVALLHGVAVIGIAYVAYLCSLQNKKKWSWILGFTALWVYASLSGGSVSFIPMVLNAIALGVLVVAVFKLRLD